METALMKDQEINIEDDAVFDISAFYKKYEELSKKVNERLKELKAQKIKK